MPSRRIYDIPFPSFSLVMSQSSTSSMRLPTYRSSYLLRFHPYPRVKLSQRESLMCDVVEEDEDVGARPAILDFAGAKPRDRRFSLTILIIVARKLALKAK
ncbi:hypothetical protein EDD22DRAFT_864199 [Suillus occidentalis]|nr:hypothetical protein EDD22DRAFT_864199 [Suillus occidentalis]